METARLNLLLMGKTGNGKSATGNTLLNRHVFKSTANVMSETKVVDSCFSQFQGYMLLVVDGPGLEDSNIHKTVDREVAARNMDTALAMCYGGVDAFLLVLKFGVRLTLEDKLALKALKQIFGDSYMDHVIVIMTGGDLFQMSKEDERVDIGFDEWCRKQKGEFCELYEDCKRRFVLFNNREKNQEKKEAQVQQVVQLAHNLSTRSGRYTAKCFQDAQREREKLILQNKALMLKRDLQEKMCLLAGDIEHLCKQSSYIESGKEKIRVRMQDLKLEILDQDNNSGNQKRLLDVVENMEENLNDVFELQSLVKTLEAIRQAKHMWSQLGSVCSFWGGSHSLATEGTLDLVSGTTIEAVATSGNMNFMKTKLNQNRIE